jgi:hypothetical protein
VQETRVLLASEVEDKIEQLCLKFEDLKPYLISHWRPGLTRGTRNSATPSPEPKPKRSPAEVEV